MKIPGFFHLSPKATQAVFLFAGGPVVLGGLPHSIMAGDPLAALREALRLSPNSIPLRQHFADSWLQSGRAGDAEAEYREALALAPISSSLKLALTRAC